MLRLAADLATRTGSLALTSLDQLYRDLLDRVSARHPVAADALLAVLAAAGPGPVLPFDVLAGAVGRLGVPLSRAGLHALLGDADLYPVLDRALPGQADEHLGLFHQTLVDHLLAGIDRVVAHRALADTFEDLATASEHDPKDYRSDPLFRYAFDAGPRHRWEAGQPELLVADLAQRTDPVPRVNLARWTTWANRLRDDLGPDHPDTLTTRHNIAFWTGEAGEPAEALRLFRELLPDSERVLGRDHPDTLRTRSNIARWTGRAGDLAFWTGEAGEPAEALRLYRELLPDVERVLGRDHPGTVTIRHAIAGWTGEAGKPAEALRLLRELLPHRERVLGRDHPDTLTTRHAIAGWTGKVEEPAEALRLYRELLPDIERVLGPDHPETLAIRDRISDLEREAGDES